jgi:YHS domain-containing protein
MIRILKQLVLALALVAGFSLRADEAPAGKPQTTCPICKAEVSHKLYADFEGKRVFFGCAGCDVKFNKDAAAIVKQMEADGITLVTVKPQTICPVSGEELDKTVFVDQHGSRIYFCCKKCRANFSKDPAKALDELGAAGIAFEKAPAVGSAPAKSEKPAMKHHEGHADHDDKK